MYETYVRLVNTYAIKTKDENAQTKRQLRTTDMRTLKNISGYTLYDHKRNGEIRKICGNQDVVGWARTRRRQWGDHVDRMPENRPTKIAKTEKSITPRLPG